MTIQLNKIKLITAKMELLTGMHIGGNDSTMKIGGIDSSVTKNPLNNLPYAPGSSLKGKMRSMMEQRSGCLTSGNPLNLKNKNLDKSAKDIIKLFGSSADANDCTDDETYISRLSFWDSTINQGFLDKIENRMLLSEEKSENIIDRITSTAEAPRFIERVPAGTVFDFKVTIKEFSSDTDLNAVDLLLQGMKLLELDGIGGSVSRGYGKIQFSEIQVIDGNNKNSLDEQFSTTSAF